MHTACVKARYGVIRIHPQITSFALSSAGGAAFLPARTSLFDIVDGFIDTRPGAASLYDCWSVIG